MLKKRFRKAAMLDCVVLCECDMTCFGLHAMVTPSRVTGVCFDELLFLRQICICTAKHTSWCHWNTSVHVRDLQDTTPQHWSLKYYPPCHQVKLTCPTEARWIKMYLSSWLHINGAKASIPCQQGLHPWRAAWILALTSLTFLHGADCSAFFLSTGHNCFLPPPIT